MLIVLTTEELDCIRDQAMARAEEVEWQLRREIARLHDVEAAMLRILGDANGTHHAPGPVTTPAAPPARPLRRTPPAPPRYASKAEELRAQLLRPLARN